MNYLTKLCALLLLLSFTAVVSQAQADKKKKSDNKENIIILKKGDSKQKFTIEIDGDKLTVNGKPVEDFKSDDLEILRDEDADKFTMRSLAPEIAMGMGPGGKWDLLGKDFMKEIHSNKAFLGVMTQKTDEGAKITDVTKESTAEKAGLKEGDIITKINDDKISDAGDLYKAVGKYKPDDKVTITYKREGKESAATAALGENKQVQVFNWNNNGDYNLALPPRRPFKDGFTFAWKNDTRLGLQVQDTEDSKGVKVLDVEDETPAEKAGIKEDDIITQINGKDITSIEDLKNGVKDVKAGDTIKLTFLRNSETQTVTVKFPKELKTTDL